MLDSQVRLRNITQQVENNIAEGKKQRFVYHENNEFILPGYSHPNRPAPSYKRADDPIHRLRYSYDLSANMNNINGSNNTLATSSPKKVEDGSPNFSTIKNNPITLPYSDLHSNKYMDKEYNKLQKSYS